MMKRFKEDQLVLYKGVNGYEIGKIKRIRNDDKAFVWYHSGDTAALTDFDLIQPIINDYCIQDLLDKEAGSDNSEDYTDGMAGLDREKIEADRRELRQAFEMIKQGLCKFHEIEHCEVSEIDTD